MKMELPKTILWLGSRKSSPYAYAIAGALLLMLVVVAVYISYQTRCEDRIHAIRANIKALRSSIQVFYRSNGRYPHSLEEFRQWAGAEHGSFWKNMYVDLKSTKQSDVPEYRELNNKAGYYYDPNNGETRLNLTRPVTEYLPRYRGRFKDAVPSSW